MANAVPVHPKSPEEGTTEAAKKPAKKGSGPEKVQNHLPVAPGNHYELPDGTICEDH